MKKYIRNYFVILLSLWLVSQIMPTVIFGNGWQTAIKAALGLLIVNLFVKPIINLLFLPINLLTLGSFRWLANVAGLYLVTLFVTDFKIEPFVFSGWNFSGFIVPMIRFNFFWALFLVSFLISFVTVFVHWLFRK